MPKLRDKGQGTRRSIIGLLANCIANCIVRRVCSECLQITGRRLHPKWRLGARGGNMDLTIEPAHNPDNSELFLVRLWVAQSTADGQATWHGKVLHVLDGSSSYFQDWQMLVEVLQRTITDKAGTE